MFTRRALFLLRSSLFQFQCFLHAAPPSLKLLSLNFMAALYATLALRGDATTQRLLLLNVQRYLQPDAVVVHVSRKSSLQAVTDMSEEQQPAICGGCLLINPEQHEAPSEHDSDRFEHVDPSSSP